MAISAKGQRAVVLDAPSAADFDAADADYTDYPGQPEPDGDASLCPSCGEPLTWHEQPCRTPTAPPADVAPAEEVAPMRPAGSFAYPLGRLVLPATQEQAHPVVWRGQLRERNPATGLVHRVNVYRLGDGYWDCYREEELRAA